MKNLIAHLAIFTVLFLTACNSKQENARTSATQTSVVVATTSTSEVNATLEKIKDITDPAEANRIYQNAEVGSKLETAAHAQWEKLMLEKISATTDPDAAHKIYYDATTGSKIENAARTKWEELMLAKIKNITKADDAHKIYQDATAHSKIESAAKEKWEELKNEELIKH